MQTICRLIQMTQHDAEALRGQPARLAASVAEATLYSDVYRYWHGIQFLLNRHAPGTPAARWLDIGISIPGVDASLPADRLILPADVTALHEVLASVPEDDLLGHYDAAAMDAAHVYPETWQVWEQDFDPLGQTLEHYSFLREFVAQCAQAGAALLLHFEFLAEGNV